MGLRGPNIATPVDAWASDAAIECRDKPCPYADVAAPPLAAPTAGGENIATYKSRREEEGITSCRVANSNSCFTSTMSAEGDLEDGVFIYDRCLQG
jgi:hypothetical protein